MEYEGVDLNTEGGHVFLFELSGQMSFNESRFAGSSVADKHQLEGGHVLLGFGHRAAFISEMKIVQIEDIAIMYRGGFLSL